MLQDRAQYPAYATVSASGNTNYTFSGVLPQSLTTSDHSSYINGVWYGSTITIDINLTDGQTHRIAAYFFDGDNSGRGQTVKILNQDSGGAILDTRTVSGFYSAPVYLVWNCAGHVAIQIVVTAASNCVISGFFFDPPSGTTSTNSASFLTSDTTTHGDWVGVYGSGGYNIYGDTSSYPTYVTSVTAPSAGTFTNGTSVSALALQKASNHAVRVDAGIYTASTLYGWYAAPTSTGMQLDVTLNDSLLHSFALYCWDSASSGRQATVQVIDGLTGALLETRTLGPYTSNSAYTVWGIKGHVVFFFKYTPGSSTQANFVAAGLFFDAIVPASIAASPASAAQGAAVTLTVTGTNTHFAGGTTTVSFSGSGITVGTITVASVTSLTAAITISSSAATGASTLTVTTGAEAPTATFSVTPGQRGNIDYDQIRSTARQGSGAKLQMFGGGTAAAGHLAVYDANGNVVDGGSPGTGSVTSVGLSMPAEFSVANSPITSAGTLAVTKANIAANAIYAGPASGGAAAPTFRALAATDIPQVIKVNGTPVGV